MNVVVDKFSLVAVSAKMIVEHLLTLLTGIR